MRLGAFVLRTHWHWDVSILHVIGVFHYHGNVHNTTRGISMGFFHVSLRSVPFVADRIKNNFVCEIYTLFSNIGKIIVLI